MPVRIIPASASENAEYGLRFIMAKSFCLEFYLVQLLSVLLFFVDFFIAHLAAFIIDIFNF